MINNKNKINHITHMAIIAGLASAISVIDKAISVTFLSFVPGIKIGMANIVILYSIIRYDIRKSLVITITKIFISNLILGGITSIMIGGTASLLSFFIMYYLYKKSKMSLISISVIGGFIHINTQLLVIQLLYDIGKEIYIYGFILILISLLTSIIIGITSQKLKKLNF